MGRLSFLKVVHPYFDSEWSYAKVNLAERIAKVAFLGRDKKCAIITQEGIYYEVSFENKTGVVKDRKSFLTL